MPVQNIHTYLVHPGKGVDDVPEIGGTSVELEGKLFNLLDGIYTRSDSECVIEISFNHSPDGEQQNDCRDLILRYLEEPTLARGRRIAQRLQGLSDRRSGLGLLFLISGMEGREHKIVISRFPTDSAILAEEDQNDLSVEFLERVFMKSATAYKAAAYQHKSLLVGFWRGHAIDRQINSRAIEISEYWIAQFLASGFSLTPAAGSRRLAITLRNAAKNSDDVGIKSEIAAVVTLARGLGRASISIKEFAEHFGLSDECREAINAEIKSPRLVDEQFQFDLTEFSANLAYRSVELNNGAVLTAQSGEFEEVFQREPLKDRDNEVRFSTVGEVIDEKLKKVRS